LDRRLAEAPADPTDLIDRFAQSREVLLVRLRTFESTEDTIVPDGLQRRVGHLDRRLEASQRQLEERRSWMADHDDLIAEYGTVTAAERAVEARIRQRPLAHLSGEIIEHLGPEPTLQRERAAWTTAATAVAMHRHRYGIEDDFDADLDGPAALLGDRPTEPVAAGSWDIAARKVAVLDFEADLDSGVAL